MDHNDKYIKYILLKTQYGYGLPTGCSFDEKIIKKLVSEKIEPPVRISINNINNKTDQVAFGLIKYGYKNGECFNDNHLKNAMSVFKKRISDENCLFDDIIKKIIINKNKKIFIIDGMNFVTSLMKYIVTNKNEEKIEKLMNSIDSGDLRYFYELCKKTTDTEIDKILMLDQNIGKNEYSKNLFRINFLKDSFDKLFTKKNKEEFYIVFHHGYNYVESYIKGNLNRNNPNQLYRNILRENNYILIATYLESSMYTNINTYKGKINDLVKNELIKNNKYNEEELEKIINEEFESKMYFKQQNDQIIEDFKNKFFENIGTNNILSTRICKNSNETDDYCILILYYYVKEILHIENVAIVSDDRFGWNKDDMKNENIIKADDFII